MKRKAKILIFSSLILGTLTFSLSELTSCSNVDIKGYGKVIIKEEINGGGFIKASKEGNLKIGTLVTILASPNEGYEVDKYYLNDEILESNTFKVIEGINEVSASFKIKEKETLYGTVEIIKDKVINGTIEAYLEDEITPITNENKRLEVGTKVVIKTTPKDKTYKIKEIKLNEEILKFQDDKYIFEVIEGKNFLSAIFDFINPNKGLVELKEVNNATINIKNNDININKDEYLPVDSLLTIEVLPNTNYVSKKVLLNGTPLERISLKDNIYIYEFKILEGLNLIEVEIANEANEIEIIPDETWIKKEHYNNQYRYDVEKGATYQLKANLLPVGSFSELIWEKGEFDEGIKITQEGILTILEATETNSTIKVSLKDDPSIFDTITIRPISSGSFKAHKLADKLVLAKEKEIKDTKKVIFKEIIDDEYTKSSKNMTFEVFDDLHSLTSITDDEGIINYFYEGINGSNFFQLVKEGKITEVLNKIEIDEENKNNINDYLNTFGSIEFLDNNGLGNKYIGLSDYINKAIIEEFFTFGDDGSGGNKDIRENLICIINDNTYKFESTCITQGLMYKEYETTITCNISFNDDDSLKGFNFKQTDKLLKDDGTIDENAKVNILERSGSIEYGIKEKDPNNYFNFDDYYLKDFNLGLFKDDINETEILPNEENKYEILVGEDLNLKLLDLNPTEFNEDIDEIEAICSKKDEEGNIQVGNYYNGEISITPNKPGNYEITVSSNKVNKTINLIASYAPISSISFSKLEKEMFVGSLQEIDARVEPFENVENKDVIFEIIGDDLGSKLVETETSWGTKKMNLQAGNISGEIILRAKAKGDENIYVDEVIKIKEVPPISESIIDKEFIGSSFDLSTYNTNLFTLNITKVDELFKGTLKVEQEDYYEYTKEVICNYNFDVSFVGGSINLTNISCDKEIYKDKLLNTIISKINNNGEVESLTLTFNEEQISLKEDSGSDWEWGY